ncbi:MAG TPA: beta-phosphoglucomutase, partial [Propionibacteriaceae bacterium]
MNDLQAVIFDLDGVLTDTAEYHYRAWKRLADEEGMPFDRRVNERLRGVGRRESLQIILADKPATEAAIAEMTDRKNAYYVDLLDEISAADLLPGARELLLGLRRAGIKTAIGSASKNTPTVLNRLGICDLLDTVVDGNMVTRSKPAPDVFLKAAELLDVAPGLCAVVEDGAAGVDAALAAGMWAVGLGPDERVGHAHVVFPDLSRVDVPELLTGLEDAAWTLRETR